MKSRRRYILFITCFLAIAKFMSCEPEDWKIIDCYDCYSYKPDSANLIIKLTINAENDSIPLTFYKGRIEDGIVDWLDTATENELRLYSEIGQLYSVRAEYKSGNETIIAIDSDRMRIANADEDCGYPCFIVKGGVFDLELLE